MVVLGLILPTALGAKHHQAIFQSHHLIRPEVLKGLMQVLLLQQDTDLSRVSVYALGMTWVLLIFNVVMEIKQKTGDGVCVLHTRRILLIKK